MYQVQSPSVSFDTTSLARHLHGASSKDHSRTSPSTNREPRSTRIQELTRWIQSGKVQWASLRGQLASLRQEIDNRNIDEEYRELLWQEHEKANESERRIKSELERLEEIISHLRRMTDDWYELNREQIEADILAARGQRRYESITHRTEVTAGTNTNSTNDRLQGTEWLKAP